MSLFCSLNFLKEELVNAAAFRYITDAITKEEALELLKKGEAKKKEREENVRKLGSVHCGSA